MESNSCWYDLSGGYWAEAEPDFDWLPFFALLGFLGFLEESVSLPLCLVGLLLLNIVSA